MAYINGGLQFSSLLRNGSRFSGDLIVQEPDLFDGLLIAGAPQAVQLSVA